MIYPNIRYPDDYDEWDFVDMEELGAERVQVDISSDQTVYLQFMTPARLSRHLDGLETVGIPCVDSGRLVVVKKVTKENIAKSVAYLYEKGWLLDKNDNSPNDIGPEC